MAVLFFLLALIGIAYGLKNVARPGGRLGLVSRSRAWWLVGGSLLVLIVAGQAMTEGGDDGPGPGFSGSTTTLPEAGVSTTAPTLAPSSTSSSVTPGTTPPPDTTVQPAPTTTSIVTTSPSSTAAPDGPTAAFAPPRDGPSGDPSGPMPATAEAARVVFVIDGDTLEVDRAGTRERVRLIGINSPESGECWADEAGRVLEALAPQGAEVGMTVDESDRDQFGRLLRYLWVGAMSVNEELVRRGAAISRRYPPDTSTTGRLDAAQADAERDGRGLWAADACGPSAEAELVIDEVFYDAPGNDNENLNEEWVRVSNAGGGVVDLSGWGIKDESASHRYDFPPGFILAPGESVTIYTGCGTDFDRDLYWCKTGSAVWNNDGDTAFLTDPNGNTHHLWHYSP